MSNSVWISDMLADPEINLWVTNDLVENDKDKFIEGQKLLAKGVAVPEEACPKRIWGNPDEDAPTLTSVPDLFGANGQYIVSDRAACILRQFDLGDGALYPVQDGVFQNDNRTRIPGEFFTWIFGNVKTAVLGEESINLREFAPGFKGWWALPFVLRNNDVAVSRWALDGPDVWMDPTLFKSVFLSGPLGDAFQKAGFSEAFRLKTCRVM